VTTSNLGREIIEAFEGCMQVILGRPGFYSTYRDSAGVLTIGYGHTNAAGLPHISPGVVWSQRNCDDTLSSDLHTVEQWVMKIAAEHNFILTQSAFDALVSFDYNTGALARSSIPAKLQEGDNEGAIRTLLLYDHSAGVRLAGLTRRRQCEAALMRGNLQEAANLADVHLQQDPVQQIQTALAVPHPAADANIATSPPPPTEVSGPVQPSPPSPPPSSTLPELPSPFQLPS